MNKYYYDLHLHSCLSPCGDDDNTPNNICGMASLLGLNVLALTDHNTVKNCPAFFEAAKRYGIIPIAGMELTTSEDIHIICLFEELADALLFDEYVHSKRVLIKNKPDFFGRQQILDGDDNVLNEEEYLLSNATKISAEDVFSLVSSFGGISYPAHIDREANGMIAVLGSIPPDTEFKLFELNDKDSVERYSKEYGIPEDNFVICSDAHILTDMREGDNFFLLDDEPYSSSKVRSELFKLLSKRQGGLK